MSKLDDLIKELCPEGVEYKRFDEACTLHARIGWQRLTKAEYKTSGKYMLITGTDFTPTFEINYGTCVYVSEERYRQDPKIQIKNGDVLITKDGTLGKVAFVQNLPMKATLNGGVFVVRGIDDSLLARFIMYYLLSNHFKSVVEQQKTGSTISHLTQNLFSRLLIPVPPLPVQAEIVRILDNFTALTAELTAELTKRRQQYEHYRESLLSDETIRCFDDSFLQLSLENLFETRNGYTPSKSNHGYWSGETIVPWFRMEDIREGGRILSDSAQHVTPKAIKGELYPAHSYVISTSATIGEHALIEVPFLANQRFTILTIKEQYRPILDTKYIFHYCYKLAHYCKEHLNQGNFASVDMTAFRKFTFSIPSIEIQRRIATILDRFDALCNDLTSGLPAEIEARKKQYEHYRDKLLSFEPRR